VAITSLPSNLGNRWTRNLLLLDIALYIIMFIVASLIHSSHSHIMSVGSILILSFLLHVGIPPRASLQNSYAFFHLPMLATYRSVLLDFIALILIFDDVCT
jgi:hypothetical protein